MKKKIAVLALTAQGRSTAGRIVERLADAELVEVGSGIRQALELSWDRYEGLVCIMATGIVVRCIAGLCRSKLSDPAIVVVDENGRYAISLLSGHIGGGNRLAEEIAVICGAEPVITTASDVAGHTALDLWAIENNLSIDHPERLASFSARLLNQGALQVFKDENVAVMLPDDLTPCEDQGLADIIISCRKGLPANGLQMLPRQRYVGIGCRRGTGIKQFEAMLEALESEHGIDRRTIASLASIDLKRDENGLLEVALRNKWPVRFFGKEQLNSIDAPSKSLIVKNKIGVNSVCEAAAMLAAGNANGPGRLIVEKIKWKNITAAVAEPVL